MSAVITELCFKTLLDQIVELLVEFMFGVRSLD